MAFKRTTVADLPQRTRRARSSKLLNSDEFLKTKLALSDGLKVGEALVISFSPKERAAFGLKGVGRLFLLRIKQFIKSAGLDYDVERYKSGDDEVIQISFPVDREVSKRPQQLQADKSGWMTPAKQGKQRRADSR
jgi:hypothetical protein